MAISEQQLSSRMFVVSYQVFLIFLLLADLKLYDLFFFLYESLVTGPHILEWKPFIIGYINIICIYLELENVYYYIIL